MRTPAERRWCRLSVLLGNLERLVEASSRLDAYLRTDNDHGGRPAIRAAQFGAGICARLDLVEGRVRREANRLTVERLESDLARRKAAA